MTDLNEARITGPETSAGYEQNALSYLSTAEAVLIYAQAYADRNMHSITTHPEYYENSGLTHRQLTLITRIGHDTLTNATYAAEHIGSIVPNRIRVTSDLVESMTSYRGIDEGLVLSSEYRQAFQRYIEKPDPLPVAIHALDRRIEAVGKVLDDGPYIGDICTLVGLSILRLAQFVNQPNVQSKIKENSYHTDRFKQEHPLAQAALLIGSFFVDGQSSSLQNTLADTLFGTTHPNGAQLAVIRPALVELQFTQRVREYTRNAKKIFTLFGSMMTAALAEASNEADLYVDSQPDVDELTDDDVANATLLEQEAKIVQSSKVIQRRAHTIIQDARKLHAAVVTVFSAYSDDFSFPIAETPLRDLLFARDAALRAGEFAAGSALRHDTYETAMTELGELNARYIVSRSAVRRHAEGNRITSLLVTGKDGASTLDLPRLGKDEAFDTAGLVIALERLLNAQQNVDVFGSLFDAVRREDALRKQIGTRAPRQSVAISTAWLVDNMATLRRSPIAVLRSVGDSLTAYRLAQETSPDPMVRPKRNVSVETLHRIEGIRSRAEQLEIRAFPPGSVNVGELINDARAVTGVRSRTGPTLEEERLLVLDELGTYLLSNGYENIRVYRLRPGSLKQSIPYYALVLELTDRKIIIAENPKKPNRTYVFEEVNPEAVIWEELIQLTKDAIRDFGGRGMNHVADQTLDYHVERVKKEVIKRLNTNPTR